MDFQFIKEANKQNLNLRTEKERDIQKVISKQDQFKMKYDE